MGGPGGRLDGDIAALDLGGPADCHIGVGQVDVGEPERREVAQVVRGQDADIAPVGHGRAQGQELGGAVDGDVQSLQGDAAGLTNRVAGIDDPISDDQFVGAQGKVLPRQGDILGQHEGGSAVDDQVHGIFHEDPFQLGCLQGRADPDHH